MKYCWSHNDTQASIAAPAAVLFSAACMASIFRGIFQSAVPWTYLLIAGCFMFPLLFLLLQTAFVCTRRYQICPEGMTIRYPLGFTIHHPREDFSEIALCKIHYASASTVHILAIRCVIGEEKHGPRQAIVGKERWTRMGYEVLRFRNVISIYHTSERIAELHKLCPHPIRDYRHPEDRS